MTDNVHSTTKFAVERYLLGEMPDEERQQFEEHYFSCPECAESVTAAAAFIDGARLELPHMDRPKPAPAPKKARFEWLNWRFLPQTAFAAIALLAVVVSYQNVIEIPHLKAHADDQALVAEPGRVLSARRAQADLTFSRKLPAVSLLVPNEWEQNFARYSFEVQTAPGERVMESEPIASNGPLVVSLPTGRLSAGNYVIVLYGLQQDGGNPEQSRQVVGRYPLTVQD